VPVQGKLCFEFIFYLLTKNFNFFINFCNFSYRQTVLRALPNLKKLDNVDVTSEEVAEAIRSPLQRMEESFEETSYSANDRGEQNNTNHHQQSQQQQHYRNQSPVSIIIYNSKSTMKLSVICN